MNNPESFAGTAHWTPPVIDKIALGNEFFLSKTNPLATADQRDLDALLLEVMQMPAVVRASCAWSR